MKDYEVNLEISCLIEQKIRNLEYDIMKLQNKRDEFYDLYVKGELEYKKKHLTS